MAVRSASLEVRGAEGEAVFSPHSDSSAAIMPKPDPQAIEALRAEGLARLKANDFPRAVELLARAVSADPRDGQTQLDLGIALQGARHHEQALKCFVSAQKLLPDEAAPFLHAAISHLNLNQAQDALRTASEACYRAPHLAEAHYTYGQAWLATNDAVQAERAFAEAIRLTPSWPEAWVNYGIARYRQGAVEDAKTAMRQALMHAPAHPAATANLGAFMRISGESQGAERLLRASLQREPNNIGARLNLAADFLQDERAADALALLDQPEPPTRDQRAARHWYLQKSLALLQLGRLAEAKAVLEALSARGPLPAEVMPLWHWRQVLVARGESDMPRALKAAKTMEASLGAMGPDAVLEHRIMGHYDLAKFYSGQQMRARAFAHWLAGHRLLKPSQPFSRDDHRAFVDANIAAFDKTRFARGQRSRNSDAAPIFIVGMPRSGTTLCEQILAAHAQVHGAGERMTLPNTFAALGEGDKAQAVRKIAALDADALDRAAWRYLNELRALAPDKTRIVDKLPGNFLYLGLAGLMLPGAKIIHCVRDPRDIGLSIFTFRFHGAHGYAHDLGDLGWYIGEHDRLAAHWRSALPNPILTVKLSDWIEDFDGTLKRVLDHVDLPHDDNCARFYEADSRVRTVSYAQVRQPVNARGLGRWRAYADELAPLIKELEDAGSLEGWGDASISAVEGK
jgi:Flp pilus assembly protein TadD